MQDALILDNFTDIELIGKGLTSTVFRATHLATKKKVAIKRMERSNFMSPKFRSNFETELKILEVIDHPFIAHFYQILEGIDSYYLVLELAEGGALLETNKSNNSNNGRKITQSCSSNWPTFGGTLDGSSGLNSSFTKSSSNGINLSNYLDSGNNASYSSKEILSESEAARIFCQLLSAVRYLHKVLNVIHRDIKLRNILLDENRNVRLIDFGLAKITASDLALTTTLCGSYPFVAPEILRNEKYSNSVDIWSLGVVLYVMVSGKLPFQSPSQAAIIDKILNENVIFPQHISSNLFDLLHRLFVKNPNERITIDEICEHPWIVSSGYKYMLDDEFIDVYGLTVKGQIDASIAKDMLSKGLDPNKRNDLGSDDATYYRIMRKEKLKSIIANLSQSGSEAPKLSKGEKTIALNSIDLTKHRIQSLKGTQSIALLSSFGNKLVYRRIRMNGIEETNKDINTSANSSSNQSPNKSVAISKRTGDYLNENITQIKSSLSQRVNTINPLIVEQYDQISNIAGANSISQHQTAMPTIIQPNVMTNGIPTINENNSLSPAARVSVKKKCRPKSWRMAPNMIFALGTSKVVPQ
ncbi:CAMK family protein kinase [Tritrichomonas foetus]|uniref:CAMK family protein kinase n=1 Tax=Tritrichomonas foetus TaxID=1144522 RepID=A0A1J4JLD1_9EUKA|nr:CAMK family protein kinase [Tritrichomonas foetus]|eukprot:OHS99920.1 CAMK family protein kinase [Tritrichomonas foetus]